MPDSESKLELKTAFNMKTPQDSVDLYRRWAKTYDQDFAQKHYYNNPVQTADVFAGQHVKSSLPVLDVGAGTGLVGQRLAENGVAPIHAIDISPEMLEQAELKGCYDEFICADLTQPLKIADNFYDGIICCGTFTFGHVDAEAIDELVRIARPGALFVLGINAKVFESAGFAAKFDALSDQIFDFEVQTFKTYGEKASKEMQTGRSSVAVFRKKITG